MVQSRYLIVFLSIYIILLSVGSFISVSALSKTLSLLPLGLSFILLYSLLINQSSLTLSVSEVLLLLLLVISIVGHFLFAPFINVSEAVKFNLIFLMFLMGRWSSTKSERYYLNRFLLVSISILFPISLITLFHLFPSDDSSILFFSNKNNAVAYCLISAFLLRASIPRSSNALLLLLAFFWVLSLDTLGALLAFFLALFISHFKLSFKNVFLVALLVMTFVLLYLYADIPIFERLRSVLLGLQEFLTQFDLRDVAKVSYGEYASLQGGSEDVSLFFRLKQWLEISFIMLDGSLHYLIFGYGMNASMIQTSIGLVPHNDWLRVLYELGFISFVIFLILNAKIYFALLKLDKFLSVIFLTIMIFMLSENLINNFLSMSLLYFSSGYVLGLYLGVERKYE